MTIGDLFVASSDILTNTEFWIYDNLDDFYTSPKPIPYMVQKCSVTDTRWLNTVGEMKVLRFKIDVPNNRCYILLA